MGRPGVALRTLGLGAIVASATPSCHEPIDTVRVEGPNVTLGDDLYTVMCDRLGAGVLPEDLTGASYHKICHPSKKGIYGSSVDTALLPKPGSEKGKEARRLSIAKMEAMARRRGDLIRAFNATFPDIEIDDVTTSDEGDKIRLHDALRTLTQDMVPLYDENPYDANGEPLAPGVTRAVGRLFEALGENPEARTALAQIWGRQGYRPFQIGLGATRPSLAYPNLRAFAKAASNVLGPNGVAVRQLQDFFGVVKHELLTAAPIVASLPDLQIDPATAQPNRPRTNSEVMRAFLLSQAESFASAPEAPPRFLSLRDRRGFAIPFGNQPGVPGTVPPPFADVDFDGFADVAPGGRFADPAGAPLALDLPFAVPGIAPVGPLDAFGRPAQPLYQYVDSTRTVASAMSRRLVPLMDATEYGTPGDPNAWMVENETLMYALAGAYKLFGAREDAEYDYASGTIVPAGTGCESCVAYLRFRGEDSPVAELAHAAGQVLADQDSDAILLGSIDLLENHEPAVARLVGAALELRRIAADHDELAAQGVEPKAEIPYEKPIWDDMAQIVWRITDNPGLAEKLIGSLANPALVTPAGGANHMGETLGTLVVNRDLITYDKNNLNGPAVNLSVGPNSTADPMVPVDYTAPQNGDNRSCLERSLQIIHDARQVSACNKAGAKVKAGLPGFPILTWPLIGSGYDECELFQIDDLASFYLGSLLPASHPKRSELVIKSGTINTLIDYLGVIATPGELFEESSGIAGMTLFPSPPALNRLVFFGASSSQFPNMPDHDTDNQGGKTDVFISNLLEPVSSAVCAKDGSGLNKCGSMSDLFRVRGFATIFLWERLGFYEYLQPTLKAFAEVSCNEAVTSCDTSNYVGENIFIDLITDLSTHWAGPDHGPECDSTVPPSHPKYCSGAGINRYEPILADSFRSDLIPALHEFAKAAHDLSTITIARGPRAGQTASGAEVLETLTKILFSQGYAASPDPSAPGVPMTDRYGNASATWTDGTPQAQLTPYTLFADALHRFDESFTGDDGELRKAQWRRARSQLVDQFFAVEGSGPGARFKNPSTAPMLIATMRVLREQLNANCPTREWDATNGGVPCHWARRQMGDKIAEVLSGPLFASVIDMLEAVRADEPARRELQRMMSYVLTESSGDAALQASLASMVDMMQILQNDQVLTPIFQSAATAANPSADPSGAGCADRLVKVLKALTDDKYDRYHVLDVILPNLVTPLTDEVGNEVGLSPVEIFIDTIADVHRIDASNSGPLQADDYQFVMGAVRDFMVDERRGLEQFYTIMERRPRE